MLNPFGNEPARRNGRGVVFAVVVLLLLGGGVWIWLAIGKRGAQSAKSTQTQQQSGIISSSVTQTVSRSTNRVPVPVVSVPPAVTNTTPAITTNASPVITRSRTPTDNFRPNTVLPSPEGFPRPPRDVLEAQVALARLGISSGSLDGLMGSQTRAALQAFQRTKSLPFSGELDSNTRTQLLVMNPALVSYVITSNDLARLQPLSKTWRGKAQQTALDYETILELVSERGRSSPNLIKRLNPGIDWSNIVAGAEIKIPDATNAVPSAKAGFAAIKLSEKILEVFDAETNLLAHFPCSIAARFDKRPVGELHVKAIAPNPDYTFNPEVFPESEEAREIKTKLILPPGPNNPVGTAWISLDRPGYGIHGTPNPEQVGRTESHGCFRLANWNAEFFLKLAWVGMPIYVEP